MRNLGLSRFALLLAEAFTAGWQLPTVDHRCGEARSQIAPRQGALAGPCGAKRARTAAEGLTSGAKVADVARHHDVNRWQVYEWRRKHDPRQVGIGGAGNSAPGRSAGLRRRSGRVVDADTFTASLVRSQVLGRLRLECLTIVFMTSNFRRA
ncbi:transposase [Citreimonas sp.]|uniref:transposase n=1 Tax=Citreimonas sp. TaxID=3036715 RepID=UPI0035C7B095